MHVLENGLHNKETYTRYYYLHRHFHHHTLKNGLDNLVLPRLFETPLEGTFNITPD